MRTNRVVRMGLLAALLTGGLASTGCETMNNTEKGAGIGAALGTGVGLGVGALAGSPKTGAVVGGLLGGGTGALIGNDLDKKERHDREVQQAQANATAAAQAQQQRLGMTDVITMSQNNVDDQLIVNQIRNTGSTFQLSPGDLQYLKERGVSARVIGEMQTARAASPIATRIVPVATPPSTTTVIYEEPVIYPSPVYVRPYPYYAPPPRPVVVVGGGYHRRW